MNYNYLNPESIVLKQQAHTGTLALLGADSTYDHEFTLIEAGRMVEVL